MEINKLVEALDLKDVKVDRENFVIKGVKLSGRRSRNKRNGRSVVYSDNVINKTVAVFEGCPVTVRGGHNMDKRDYDSQNGQLRNGRVEHLGTEQACSRFDWHLNKKDPLTEKILEDADSFPENIPLSQELRDPEVSISEDGESFVVEDFPADKLKIGVAAVYRGGLNDSLFESLFEDDDDMEIKTTEELKARFPQLCESLVECACAAMQTEKEVKSAKLEEQIVSLEALKTELAEAKSELAKYKSAEEKAVRVESIKSDARTIICEDYEVSDDLLENLLSLEADGHKRILTEIAKHFTKPAEGSGSTKPTSASGTPKNKSTDKEGRRIGYHNLTY